ncbi:MAG: PKD domain-containing protein, partial [Methanomicrobiales archaeon]
MYQLGLLVEKSAIISLGLGLLLMVSICGSITIDGTTENQPPTCSLDSNTTSGKAPDNTTVYFIDVGQGDSIFIQTPDSRNILIDSGEDSISSVVTGFLGNHSVSTIDVMVATHPDADHIGGLDEVLESYQVLSVYHPGYERATTAYTEFINAAEDEGCPIYTDAQLDPGDMMNWSAEVDFQLLSIDNDSVDSNEASIILKMTYGTVDFLFTADMDFDMEDDLIASPYDIDIEILKVAHHGSKYATDNDFLAETTPEVGVICVGDNLYGHPTNETITRLYSHGVEVYRTDNNGTVIVTTNGTAYDVMVEKSPEINNAPTASFDYTVNDLQVDFTDTSTDIEGDALTYTWEFGDGTTSTDQNPVHTYSGNGDYTVDLTVSDGELTDMESKLVSLSTTGHVVINEVEYNPAGTDSGNEWVELYNPAGMEVDLSGWELRATGGASGSYIISSDTTLAASGYLVIEFTPGQFLNNRNESVVLEDASDVEIDRTPILNDGDNDGQTWQRVPNGKDTDSQEDWAFQTGTKGGSNGTVGEIISRYTDPDTGEVEKDGAVQAVNDYLF